MSEDDIDLIVATINGDAPMIDRDTVALRNLPDLDGGSALLTYIDQALALSKENVSPCALALVLMHNHADLSAVYGPAALIEVEALVSKRLAQVLRRGDNCVNLGQGKFAVLLQNCREDEVKTAATRIATVVADMPFECQNGMAQVIVHVGCASSLLGSATAQEFLHYAEMALSRAGGALRGVYVATEPTRLNDYYAGNANFIRETLENLQQNKLSLRLHPIIAGAQGMTGEFLAKLDLAKHTVDARVEHLSGMAAALSLREIELAMKALSTQTSLKFELQLHGQHVLAAKWQAQVFSLLEAAPKTCPRLSLSFQQDLMLCNFAELSSLLARLKGLGVNVGLYGFAGSADAFAMAHGLSLNHISFVASEQEYDPVLAQQVTLAKELGWRCFITGVNDQAQLNRFIVLGIEGMSGSLWAGQMMKTETVETVQTPELEVKPYVFSAEFETSLAQLREVLLGLAPAPVAQVQAVAA